MNTLQLITLGIGFIAQLFFASRILIQWFKSEKSHQVVSPNLFWVFSIAGSILFFIYGWLRNDFSIIFGQFISYYIYLWNLKIKGLYARIPKWLVVLLMLIPCGGILATINDVPNFIARFLNNEEIPYWLVIWGSIGQFIFTMRFVYQWYYSHKLHASVLPAMFWYISVTGSLLIVSYGFYRMDYILILGQSFGLVAYCRNIVIGKHQKAD